MASRARKKSQKRLSLATHDAKDAGLLDALTLLKQRRGPYVELLASIVVDILDRFPVAPQGPIVEIGTGTGQLRDWLPAPVRARTVHTDPSGPALRVFQEQAPDAIVAMASAAGLPFGDSVCAGALGLCVFDALHSRGGEAAVAAVAELARVLAPDARFVHFLDMATLLEAPFRKLDTDGLVPIPNVFGDPTDHEWPLDIVLFDRDWLIGLLDLTLRIGHPLPITFGLYFGAFLADPFDAREATCLFKSVASNGELRQALATQLASACYLALQHGYRALAANPFHSGKYLAEVLDNTFRTNGAFEIELSEIVTRATWRSVSNHEAPRYQSLCLGHERTSNQFPKRLLTESARTRVSSGFAFQTQSVVEAGVFVFVARRI